MIAPPLPPAVTGSVVADFAAEVALSATDEAGHRRVVLGEDRLVLAGESDRRTVPAADVFDVARDVSPRASADATETVTLAYRAGGRRETVRLTAAAETLVRFQRVLFATLLNGTEVAVRHAGAEPVSRRLAVGGGRIRLRGSDGDTDADPDSDPDLVVPREAITGFETADDPQDGDRLPVVSIAWTDGGRAVRTLVRLPSLRLLNLFGRYVRSAPGLAPEEAPEPSGPIAVLLVDDDPDDLELCELFLGRSDRLSVATATSAAGGLDRLASEPVDCVVSDFGMPGTDGVEFLRAVRERDPDLPFILFTGQGSETIAKRAIVDDVTDYVEKGIGTDQYDILAERIRRAVD